MPILLFSPMLVLGASSLTLQSLVVGVVGKLATYFITLVAAASVIVFLWGITKYIYKGDSETEREKGKNLMIWGIVGFVVMFGVWGILALFGETFGVEAVVPQFGGKANSIPLK